MREDWDFGSGFATMLSYTAKTMQLSSKDGADHLVIGSFLDDGPLSLSLSSIQINRSCYHFPYDMPQPFFISG